MVEALDHDLVFVAFLVGVADRIGGEGTGGDQALFGAGDGHIGRCCHGGLLLAKSEAEQAKNAVRLQGD
ncbi:hypothetical protein, partial [Pseudomonas putida]|uniref:hypothetical protein n=1 Tax=Pseudomonas putida TaxID=303 RepID=UPI001F3EDEF3